MAERRGRRLRQAAATPEEKYEIWMQPQAAGPPSLPTASWINEPTPESLILAKR